MKEQRTIKKIPAVTMVAACIKAETGVGPSMASGNQTCKPSWADLPTAANINQKQITSIKLKEYPPKKIDLEAYKGIKLKTIEKSKEQNEKLINPIANKKAISPKRLTIIAFNADLFACKRVYQNPIRKYEQIPIPSQPKNNCKKLPEVNRISIKNVNKESKLKNRIKNGSEFIYDHE